MNIIESLINGNISQAKQKSRHRSFMWLNSQGAALGLSPLERWNHSAFLKGWISWEEYTENKQKNQSI